MARVLAADACVLINLVATRRPAELLRALGCKLVTTPQAAAQVRFIAGPPDEEGGPTRIAVDPGVLMAGLLDVRAVPPDGFDLFVRCAVDLDDADASAIALSSALGVALATDDAAERRVAAREAPGVKLVRTLSLIREAAGAMGLEGEPLADLARNLRAGGNFLPPRGDPDGDWFGKLVAGAESPPI